MFGKWLWPMTPCHVCVLFILRLRVFVLRSRLAASRQTRPGQKQVFESHNFEVRNISISERCLVPSRILGEALGCVSLWGQSSRIPIRQGSETCAYISMYVFRHACMRLFVFVYVHMYVFMYVCLHA